ncbi:MAG: hypothetical protein EBS84_10355 [Proteobacteria bacterium]|nr:hypothetical protein [Verrucomicrobiota bacterium]NBU09404.1 hypothetical protein [Pseudomonadota bacterium]
MEFLKNHYEKLILGLMFLLMAIAGVVLALEVGSVQEELDKYRKLTLEGGGKAAQKDDMASFSNALHSAMQPQRLDFAQVHRVFNPFAWYADTNGVLIAGTNLGVSRLTVEKIVPQQLKVELAGIGGTPGRESVALNVTREFARTVAEQKARKTLGLNTTNATINTIDPIRKVQLIAREIGGTADAPEVKLELVEPGKDPIQIVLTKAQPFVMVYEYVAELYYAPDQQIWRLPQRRDAQLVFAGDTNIIVEITATNVLLRATSNDKTTTKPLAPSLPAAPGTKAP